MLYLFFYRLTGGTPYAYYSPLFRATVAPGASGMVWLIAERATGETLRAGLALDGVESSDR